MEIPKNPDATADFRLELKEEFKTFVLKEDHLLLERIRFQYDGWVRFSYTVKERYDYQYFKEIILRKEAFSQRVKTISYWGGARYTSSFFPF